jgi:hypothetical protein
MGASGAIDDASFAPSPCETGHLPLDAWNLDGRTLVRACGALADSPDSEETFTAMPSTLGDLLCPSSACAGGSCSSTWLWLRTPRSCDDVAASLEVPEGDRRIDPDGFAGPTPAVVAACRVLDGAGYTRVLGVEWTAGDPWIDGIHAEPVGDGLVSAAALRGYVDARALSSWPVAASHARYLFRCQAEGGAVVEVLTTQPATALYLQGLADFADASGPSFIRLDAGSYLTDKSFAWGVHQSGTWGDPQVATTAEDRLALVPIVLYGGHGLRHASFRVQAGEMQCDDRAPNTSGRWEVWIR